MNIEDKLSELGLDLQALPEEMNKSAMRKTMTRKRTIHNIGVAGKSVLITIAALILILFAGVNTSKEFAHTCVNTPLIGTISQTFIVREDIREDIRSAIEHHDELEKAIEAGSLTDVGVTVSGKNHPVEMTLDSVIFDDHTAYAFIRIHTDLEPEKEFRLIRGSIYNLDTSRQISITNSDPVISGNDDLVLLCLAYRELCPNFSISFELADMGRDDPYPKEPMESFHFEFHNVQIKESREYSLNWSIELEGHELYFDKLVVSETASLLFYRPIDEPELKLRLVDAVIEDENGKVIGDELDADMDSASFKDEEGNVYMMKMLKSIYYENASTIRIHIRSCRVDLPTRDLLWIDPENNTATFDGTTFPITQYTYDEADQKYQLTENDIFPWQLTDCNDWNKEDVIVFMVPVKEGMPKLNARFISDNNTTVHRFPSPKRNVDGQEYYMILENKNEMFTKNKYLYYKDYNDWPEEKIVDQYYDLKT
ncbi:MAG: hypothetical protein IKZ90_11405 [Clostridiales bacterium]|nr:hypothetical protein [Clostridiales bacterium]